LDEVPASLEKCKEHLVYHPATDKWLFWISWFQKWAFKTQVQILS